MKNASLPYIMLSMLPMFICFFWTVIYLCGYRKERKDRKILFWFMLTATFLYFAHFIFFNHVMALIPLTDTIYNFTTIAVYPIYYIYIVSLTGTVRKSHLTTLIPAILASIVIGICYLAMPADVKTQFIHGYEFQNGSIPDHPAAQVSMYTHDLVKIILSIQIIPILYFGLKKLKCFKSNVEDYFSGDESSRLKGIRTLLIFFVITSIASATANIIGRAFFTDTAMLVAIPSLLFSTLLFAVGYAGSIQEFTVEDLMKEKSPDNSQETAQEADENCLQLRHEIDGLMVKDQLYLDPQLKVSDIAERLNTNRTYVYNALKFGYSCDKSTEKKDSGTSFTEYVNSFRIHHAMDRLAHETDGNTCIEEIIYASGFQSKTTFYNNFKKITGTTPKEYLKNCTGCPSTPTVQQTRKKKQID